MLLRTSPSRNGFVKLCRFSYFRFLTTSIPQLETLHIQAIEQRAIDAEENRRNQELFIDMASHELRNPLSGVWQNAEVVSGSLERILDLIEDIRSGTMPDEETLEDAQKEMQENIESVESIILCAAHQGRIADGQSRFSLLLSHDSPAEWSRLIRHSQRFETLDGIAQHQQMLFRRHCEDGGGVADLRGRMRAEADHSSTRQESVDFATARGIRRRRSITTRPDSHQLPHQLGQGPQSSVRSKRRMLILLSFQYTSDSKRREITVYLDACSTPPPPTPGSMRVGANATLMIPENQTPPAPSSTTSSATSTAIPSPLSESTTPNLHPLDPAAAMSPAMNSVWLTVSVKDSGKGLSAQDMSKLFERFSQANPKTDVRLRSARVESRFSDLFSISAIWRIRTRPVRFEEAGGAARRVYRGGIDSDRRFGGIHLPFLDSSFAFRRTAHRSSCKHHSSRTAHARRDLEEETRELKRIRNSSRSTPDSHHRTEAIKTAGSAPPCTRRRGPSLLLVSK